MSAGRKIRVLRIINRFNIGGPTFNATFLTRFLSSEFETMLVGGLPEEGEENSLHVLEEYGVTPVLIPELQRNPNFFSDRKALVKLKGIIRDFQPDIVHTHASKAGALGRKAAFDLGVPVVLHTFHGHVFHSYFGVIKTLLFKTIERRLARRSNAIVAISDMQANELCDDHAICPRHKLKVIPLGFDLEKFRDEDEQKRIAIRKKYQVADDEVAIAIIGRLVPIKNHDFFLKVVHQVAQQTDRKLAVFVVGDGECFDTIKLQSGKLKTDNLRFFLTSWIKEMYNFIPGMDVVCLSSLNEGTPVSLIEAQAAGVPVISGDVGGVRDVVNNGQTGYVVPRNDEKAFVQKLQFLVEDKKKRMEMSQNGWNFVRDTFHYTRLVRDMEKLYYQLLNETSSEAQIK
jgi:glycosyltransferase involved in cell wall biosynthesis